MSTPGTWQSKLLSSAHLAAAAVSDMTEAVNDGKIHRAGNLGAGDTLTILADALRLLIEGMIEGGDDLPSAKDETTGQMHAAICKWLDERNQGFE